jgi:hypothetical protein
MKKKLGGRRAGMMPIGGFTSNKLKDGVFTFIEGSLSPKE